MKISVYERKKLGSKYKHVGVFNGEVDREGCLALKKLVKEDIKFLIHSHLSFQEPLVDECLN